ncbi:hypothetical protein Dimus_008838 [Dionaea muscipula]
MAKRGRPRRVQPIRGLASPNTVRKISEEKKSHEEIEDREAEDGIAGGVVQKTTTGGVLYVEEEGMISHSPTQGLMKRDLGKKPIGTWARKPEGTAQTSVRVGVELGKHVDAGGLQGFATDLKTAMDSGHPHDNPGNE